jgi:hypothetical protein
MNEDEWVKRVGSEPSGQSSLRVTFESTADGAQLVSLIGAIDENADLDALFARLNGDVILNLRKIERVNSMGVHRWVPLVSRFTAKQPLLIDEISYALVQNANAVANLFGAAQVRSCMAPYYCGRCNDNATVVVTFDEVDRCGSGPPPKSCARCNSAMEFDELDGYFAFFRSRSRR